MDHHRRQYVGTGSLGILRRTPRIASAFIVSVEVQRESFYMRRLVVIPLVVIVLLSFSCSGWIGRRSAIG